MDDESGIREIFGVHHMKFYIFDDDIIFSGANLSQHYFTEKQDRYFYIRNAPEIADYYDNLLQTLMNNAYQVEDDGNIQISRLTPNPTQEKKDFI